MWRDLQLLDLVMKRNRLFNTNANLYGLGEKHFAFLEKLTSDLCVDTISRGLKFIYTFILRFMDNNCSETSCKDQDFHRKYVLVPADKAANNVVVV